jgi:hypothetical protein
MNEQKFPLRDETQRFVFPSSSTFEMKDSTFNLNGDSLVTYILDNGEHAIMTEPDVWGWCGWNCLLEASTGVGWAQRHTVIRTAISTGFTSFCRYSADVKS